eukprot:3223555-Pleurochrysis_carterae.AAC.1
MHRTGVSHNGPRRLRPRSSSRASTRSRRSRATSPSSPAPRRQCRPLATRSAAPTCRRSPKQRRLPQEQDIKTRMDDSSTVEKMLLFYGADLGSELCSRR